MMLLGIALAISLSACYPTIIGGGGSGGGSSTTTTAASTTTTTTPPIDQCLTAPSAPEFSDPVNNPPNIVFIKLDDAHFMEYEHMKGLIRNADGTYGSQIVYNTRDRLTNCGTKFTNSRVNQSLCCPDRTSTIAGQYNQNTDVKNNNAGWKYDWADSYGRDIQATGRYYTSFIGKPHNGFSCSVPVPPGWDHWQGLCYGQQSMNIYTINDNGTLAVRDGTTGHWQTDEIFDRAVSDIDAAHNAGKAIMLNVWVTAPHGPIQTAARHTGQYGTWELPTTPNFNEEDVSDKPPWVSARPLQKYGQIRNAERGRLKELMPVDEGIGAVIDKLAEVPGRLENTYVILTNDNGYMRGEHRISDGKGDIYEASMQVGTIIRGPGIPAGVTKDALIGNVDWAPTFLALTGATTQRVMDGLSFLPAVVENPDVYDNRVFLHFASSQTGTYPTPQAYGLMVGDSLKYFRFGNGVQELYDHRWDPWELENLASDPRYSGVMAELDAILMGNAMQPALKDCAGTACWKSYTPPSLEELGVN